MGARETRRPPFATEPTIEILANMAKQIGEGRERMTQAFENENAIKANVLKQVFEAMKDCLPHISSKLKFGAPYDTGFELVKRKDPYDARETETLYLAEEGFFFTYDSDGIHSASPEKIIRDRWDLREIVLAIAEEMQANLDGQLRKIEGVERTTSKIAAVATLLER